MKTPIFDFVKKYSESDTSRLHMPGHKGRGPLGCECYDLTEISGADVLYSADGIILESENNLSELYGTEHSFYSTQGSTLAIFAMLSIVTERKRSDRRATVLAARNAHASFVKAAALLDFDVEWLYSDGEAHLCACNITADALRKALTETESLPNAVYVTSPDYLGNILDVRALAEVCDGYGLPLLVDNAHGAYLKFLEEDLHPITLGAAMCADSAHKTLPVLTGGAYLHISKKYPEYAKGARRALSLFASTSPSYLTLSSLDLCNAYLGDTYREELKRSVAASARIKKAFASFGFCVEKTEPLKIVINASSVGISGESLAESLREMGVEAEFCDRDYLVLMMTPSNSQKDEEKIVSAFSELSSGIKKEVKSFNRAPKKHESVMKIREAILSPSEEVSLSDSIGRICSSLTVSCPPAVPIVVSGERIEKDDVELFGYYGIERVSVVAEK